MNLDQPDRHLDEQSPLDPPATESIDWEELDRCGVEATGCDLDAPQQPLDETSNAADRALLDSDAPLDPARLRVAVADIQPSRLRPADAVANEKLARAWRADQRPEAWIGKVNDGFLDDALSGAPGRTENCADCARAFQDTLDGTPRAAAVIDGRGLGVKDGPVNGGEHISYTEQWAGERGQCASYQDIAQRVADTRGSAIIHAYGPEGGHAFNAWWDESANRVRWADAQIGRTGDWPPSDLVARFPDPLSFYFSPRRTP